MNILKPERLAVLAVLFFLLCIQPVGANAKDVTHYYMLQPDGSYKLAAIYDVDPLEAANAYQQDPSASFGEGLIYERMDSETYEYVGSGENFLNFLNAKYSLLPIDKATRCDNSIQLTWQYSCPFSCSPTTNCTGYVRWWVDSLVCLDNSPCPTESPNCNPHPEYIRMVWFDGRMCKCDPTCVRDVAGNHAIAGFLASAPVCQCEAVGEKVGACEDIPPGLLCENSLTQSQCTALGGTWMGPGTKCPISQPVPTLSEWGLIIFSLLILTLITVVVTRRRTATSADGGGVDVTLHGPMFVPHLFFKTLTATLGLAAVILVAATLLSTSIPLRDIVGTILSAGIVAYMAHLWFIGRRD